MWDDPRPRDLSRVAGVLNSYIASGPDAEVADEDRILCAEAWVHPPEALTHFIRPDEFISDSTRFPHDPVARSGAARGTRAHGAGHGRRQRSADLGAVQPRHGPPCDPAWLPRSTGHGPHVASAPTIRRRMPRLVAARPRRRGDNAGVARRLLPLPGWDWACPRPRRCRTRFARARPGDDRAHQRGRMVVVCRSPGEPSAPVYGFGHQPELAPHLRRFGSSPSTSRTASADRRSGVWGLSVGSPESSRARSAASGQRISRRCACVRRCPGGQRWAHLDTCQLGPDRCRCPRAPRSSSPVSADRRHSRPDRCRRMGRACAGCLKARHRGGSQLLDRAGTRS